MRDQAQPDRQGDAADPAWLAQAPFARCPKPSASTTCACTGAVCAFTVSEPNGAPTTVRAGRLPLGCATSFAITSATSCGFGASAAWNVVMKCLNMAPGISPTAP